MNTVLKMTFEEAKVKFPITPAEEAKWFPRFESQAVYLGGGCYAWMGYHATDTRELFERGVIAQENNISYIED